MQRMRAIDFFCGTGGFSRGAHAAGFDVVAAYDKDAILTSSFSKNFPDTKLQLTDIGALTGADVRRTVGKAPIDLIFGGPPCQGFSSIGRRDKADPRRTLLQDFFRLVSEIEPAAFVMENVLGLGYANSKQELQTAIFRTNYDPINLLIDSCSLICCRRFAPKRVPAPIFMPPWEESIW